MINYDETDENINESGSERYIDPSELIMINDNNWTPSEKFILGYANQLGFDIENDPPEMLNIAEKYLTVEIPNTYQRAFAKDNYQLVYINRITNEIKLESEIEIQAKQEYQELKEQWIKEVKEKEKEANKVTVLPRKKIAPIGRKKITEDPIRKREKEFMKIVEKQYIENEKEKQNMDKDIRQLNEKIQRDEIKNKENNNNMDLIRNYLEKEESDSENNSINKNEKIIKGNNNRNKINNNIEDEIKLEYNDESSSEKEQMKIKNKNKKNRENESSSEFFSEKEESSSNKEKNNNNNLVLKLNDSSNDDKRNKISKIKNLKQFEENLKEKKEEENDNENLKKSLEVIKEKDSEKKIKESDNEISDESDNNSFKIHRKSKKSVQVGNKIGRKNRKDSQRKIQNYGEFEILDEEDKSSINLEDNSNINNKNKSNKSKNNKNQNKSEEEKEKEDSDNDNNNNNIKQQKAILLKQAKNEYTFIKENYKTSYIKDKNLFLKEFNKEINTQKNIDLKKIKNEYNKEIIHFEEKLENKMNKELDEYKKELIEEYENDDNDENINDNDLQLKKNNLESQIRIQKERNKNKKEIEEQRQKNNLEENMKHLNEMNKIKMSRLEQQNKNKIDKLIGEFKINFDEYITDYKSKNKNNQDNIFSKNNIINDDLSINETISDYSKELLTQFELEKKSLKAEYDQKLQIEIENLKNNILSNTDNESLKYSEEKKDIENEYYSEINTIKKTNKENQKKLDETMKNLIEKTSAEFDSIKNKNMSDIKSTMEEIKEKINEIIQGKNNEEKNDINSLLEDYLLTDLISKKRVIMSKYNSLINMSEGDYIHNKIMLKYYIDIINSINQMLSINRKNINIDEILISVNQVINKYKEIYDQEKNEKLFPILFNAFNKVINLMSNDDNIINIIDNSIYGPNILNNENNMTYMNMTNYNMNNNKKIFSSFSPRKNEQIFNRTFSNMNEQRTNNLLNINNQKDESLFNININNIENNNNNIIIPEISKQIMDKISKENIQKYNVISEFLLNESKNISDELNLYTQKKDSENKINLLYQSGEFPQYNNILNRICQEENDKTNQYFRNINSKSKIFELLKKNIKDNYSFIEKYFDKTNIVDNKFNQIMNNIEEYKNNFYGSHNIFGKKNNSYYKSYNTENMLNNTFNVYNRNNYINEQSFINTTHSIDFRNNKNFFI